MSTVIELKALARERGLNGYSRLRKAKVLNLPNQPGQSDSLSNQSDRTPKTTVKKLKALARERRLKEYSILRKAELLDLLNQPGGIPGGVPISKTTVKELKALARERGLMGYSRLRKVELMTLLDQPIVKSKPKMKTGKLEDLTFIPIDHAVGKYLRG